MLQASYVPIAGSAPRWRRGLLAVAAGVAAALVLSASHFSPRADAPSLAAAGEAAASDETGF